MTIRTIHQAKLLFSTYNKYLHKPYRGKEDKQVKHNHSEGEAVTVAIFTSLSSFRLVLLTVSLVGLLLWLSSAKVPSPAVPLSGLVRSGCHRSDETTLLTDNQRSLLRCLSVSSLTNFPSMFKFRPFFLWLAFCPILATGLVKSKSRLTNILKCSQGSCCLV